MSHYDAVIIGAGNGGLAAAAVLSKHGKHVAVLEKNASPGGVAVSFRRGRFEFEVSLHELCGFGMGSTPFGGVRKLFDELEISDKIRWVHIPEAYRIITFDEKKPIDAVMPFGIPEYVDAMEQYVPGSRKAMNDTFTLAAKIRQALGALGAARTQEEKAAVLLQHSDFLHTAAMTVNEGIAALGMPPRAADIFRGYWTYLCSDCDSISLIHYLNMVNTYIDLGSVIPKARSLEIILTLSDLITDYGSDIFLNTEVSRILVKDGAAVGVVTEQGDTLSADEIICNLSPSTVFGSLIEAESVSENDRKKTNAREISGRGFCVYLGLDRSAESLGLDHYSYFIYPDMDTAKQFRLMETPMTNRVQNTVCQNVAYPDASPQGTCILTMTTLFTSDWWGGVSDAEYHSMKDRFAEEMIRTFERATGIDVGGHIEEAESATPQTFARYIHSPQGAIYGYRAAKWDNLFARRMMDQHYTDLRNLYFVGGFGTNLNGYSSALSNGADIAHSILKRGKRL